MNAELYQKLIRYFVIGEVITNDLAEDDKINELEQELNNLWEEILDYEEIKKQTL